MPLEIRSFEKRYTTNCTCIFFAFNDIIPVDCCVFMVSKLLISPEFNPANSAKNFWMPVPFYMLLGHLVPGALGELHSI